MSVRPELVGRARSLAANGFSVIPVDATTKRPHRGYSWKAMTEKPLTPDELERDVRAADADAIAVIAGNVSGGLLVIDFDVPRFYEAWLADVEQHAATLPTQRTGGGGYQVFLRCDQPGPNLKLAWAKTDAEKAGKEIAIETRGEGGYALVAPSTHPSGNRYVMTEGPKLQEIPRISMETVTFLIDCAKALDEVPATPSPATPRSSADPAAAQPPRKAAPAGANQVSVVETFNQHHSCAAVLQHHGYSLLANGQFRRPGKSDGISGQINKDDDGVERSVHYSTNDEANDGKFGNGLCGRHSAFDLFARLEHKGNFKRATAAAAKLLGLDYRAERTPAKSGKAPTSSSTESSDGGTAPPVDDNRDDGGELPDSAMETSELRAAQVLIERFGRDLRFNNDKGDWMTWSGQRWRRDAEGVIDQHAMATAIATDRRLRLSKVPEGFAAKVARTLQSSRGISSIVRLASSLPGVRIGAAHLDRDDFALNCRNGTVDLRTGELRPHAREDLLTKVCPVHYDPNATCPVWEGHLRTIFGEVDEDLVDYLQRCAGLYASGDIGVQELHVWHGEGANGKSVTYEAIMHVLGDYAGVAPEGLLVARGFNVEHPTEIADLMGKRFVIASETDAGGSLRMAMVKRLTGDAVLKARFMHKDYFEFRRTHKAILVTNHMPRVSENTEAVWRRLRMIPFNFTIPEGSRDKQIAARFNEEASGILAWIVRGSIERIRNGMQPPKSVLRATDEYRNRADTFEDFVADRLLFLADEKVSRKELAAAYLDWAKVSGEQEPLGVNQLYDRLRRLKGITEPSRGYRDWQGKVTRGFVGVRLRLTGETGTPESPNSMFDGAGGVA